MSKLKKLFGGMHISWKGLIVFALIAGAYTGLINQVGFLRDTSFRDIAVSYEVWILFAFVIAVNCEKPLEAACKVFVFFLISQSLCFIIEIPWIGASQAYYYFRLWFLKILLTFPGGFVVYYAKKDNILGALVTAAGAGMEAVFLAGYGITVLYHFPHHLLTVFFCLFTICCLIFFLIRKKTFRILAAVLVILCAGGMAWIMEMGVSML